MMLVGCELRLFEQVVASALPNGRLLALKSSKALTPGH